MATGEDDLSGRLLCGRYRVTGELGKGGMGIVVRAMDEALGREVAVKVLRARADASGDELDELRIRMQREARAAARIRHASVVTVHDVTQEDGRPVIVMELVDGVSLADVLAEDGVLPPRQAAEIGAAVADALDAAHAAGVLHRDVKPGNVLLERDGGRVVLTDFGIAAGGAGDDAVTHLTRTGEFVGSLGFLPPERAQGLESGPEGDVWSLGVTLYTLVEGHPPFNRGSLLSTLNAIVDDPLPTAAQAGPLAAVLTELTHKDPARRPTAAQARELLRSVAETPVTTAGSAHAAAAAGPAAARPSAPAAPGSSAAGAREDVPFVPSTAPTAATTAALPQAADPESGPAAAAPPQGGAASRRSYTPASLTLRQAEQPASVVSRRRIVVAGLVAAVLLGGGTAVYTLVGGSSASQASHGSLPSARLPTLGATPTGSTSGPGSSSPSSPPHSKVPGRHTAASSTHPAHVHSPTAGTGTDAGTQGGTSAGTGNGSGGTGSGVTTAFDLTIANTYTRGTITWYNRSVNVSGEDKSVNASNCRGTSVFTLTNAKAQLGYGYSPGVCGRSASFSVSVAANVSGGAAVVRICLDDGKHPGTYYLCKLYGRP